MALHRSITSTKIYSQRAPVGLLFEKQAGCQALQIICIQGMSAQPLRWELPQVHRLF